MLGKTDFKFMNRFHIGPFLACKFCVQSKLTAELSWVLGNTPDENGYECQFPLDEKIKDVLILREQCPSFDTEVVIERDTTYPGATYAPHDNNHPDLLPDSSDIDFNPNAPERCINQERSIVHYEKPNAWEECLAKLFNRKREVLFPEPKEVLRLLNGSQIPVYTFRLGLPPQKSMGFDRGLWFYRSEKFNSTLETNSKIKREMKKYVMVYLYHVWFKKLDDTKKDGYFMALDASDNYSLAKDLSWWMIKIFKDESALKLYPPDDEYEIEFIPISLLDKAQEAAMLASVDCNNPFELDLEAQEYDEMIKNLGYGVKYDSITDKDGHEIY